MSPASKLTPELRASIGEHLPELKSAAAPRPSVFEVKVKMDDCVKVAVMVDPDTGDLTQAWRSVRLQFGDDRVLDVRSVGGGRD